MIQQSKNFMCSMYTLQYIGALHKIQLYNTFMPFLRIWIIILVFKKIRKVYNFCLFAFTTHYEKNLVNAKTLVRNITPNYHTMGKYVSLYQIISRNVLYKNGSCHYTFLDLIVSCSRSVCIQSFTVVFIPSNDRLCDQQIPFILFPK